MPPFLVFIPFYCNGYPPLGRKGGAATERSVFWQRTTCWNTDKGKLRETVLSSYIWLRILIMTVLAASIFLEMKLNYMNNWPIIQWEMFHPCINIFYSRCFESLLWMTNECWGCSDSRTTWSTLGCCICITTNFWCHLVRVLLLKVAWGLWDGDDLRSDEYVGKRRRRVTLWLL